MFQLDPKIAKWLASAFGRNKAHPSQQLIHVCTISGVRMAGTTDGHRLHAVEIDSAIAPGLYALDKEAATLAPFVPDEIQLATNTFRRIDWPAIVPPARMLVEDAQKPAAPIDNGGAPCYVLNPVNGYKVNAKLLDQALKGAKKYRIRLQCDPCRPLVVELGDGEKRQFAVIMPAR